MKIECPVTVSLSVIQFFALLQEMGNLLGLMDYDTLLTRDGLEWGVEDLDGLVNILLWPFEELDGFLKDEKEKLLVVKKSL